MRFLSARFPAVLGARQNLLSALFADNAGLVGPVSFGEGEFLAEHLLVVPFGTVCPTDTGGASGDFREPIAPESLWRHRLLLALFELSRHRIDAYKFVVCLRGGVCPQRLVTVKHKVDGAGDRACRSVDGFHRHGLLAGATHLVGGRDLLAVGNNTKGADKLPLDVVENGIIRVNADDLNSLSEGDGEAVQDSLELLGGSGESAKGGRVTNSDLAEAEGVNCDGGGFAVAHFCSPFLSSYTGRGNSFSRSLYYAKKPPEFKLVQGGFGGVWCLCYWAANTSPFSLSLSWYRSTLSSTVERSGVFAPHGTLSISEDLSHSAASCGLVT